MNSLPQDELLSRCVMLDNGVDGDVEYPEGYMFMPDLVKMRGTGDMRYETSVILHAGQTDTQLDAAGKYIEEKNKQHPRYLATLNPSTRFRSSLSQAVSVTIMRTSLAGIMMSLGNFWKPNGLLQPRHLSGVRHDVTTISNRGNCK